MFGLLTFFIFHQVYTVQRDKISGCQFRNYKKYDYHVVVSCVYKYYYLLITIK